MPYVYISENVGQLKIWANFNQNIIPFFLVNCIGTGKMRLGLRYKVTGESEDEQNKKEE